MSVGHGLRLSKLLEQDGENESTRIIVGGVSLGVVGNCKGRVLEHPGVVGQPMQMIQL